MRQNLCYRLHALSNTYQTNFSELGHIKYTSKNCVERYPFGFNGQEKVNEVAGIGNWNTAEFWEYNTRTGIRANLDPVPQVSMSDYSVMGGNPIANADPDGDYFFGMIGSTSGQRTAAKEFAKSHGGTVKDLTKKSIHVDYSVGSVNRSLDFSENNNDGYSSREFVVQGKQMYFEKNGKEYDPSSFHIPAGPNGWASMKSTFLGNMVYAPANAIYTFPQQLTSGITGQDYIQNLDNSIYESHGPFGETERIDNSAGAAMTFMPMGATRAATGPAKQWIRPFGKSYSHAGKFHTMAIRWGASPIGNGKYIRQINARDFKIFNQYLRGLKLPGNGWRTADPGHLHLWKIPK